MKNIETPLKNLETLEKPFKLWSDETLSLPPFLSKMDYGQPDNRQQKTENRKRKMKTDNGQWTTDYGLRTMDYGHH